MGRRRVRRAAGVRFRQRVDRERTRTGRSATRRCCRSTVTDTRSRGPGGRGTRTTATEELVGAVVRAARAVERERSRRRRRDRRPFAPVRRRIPPSTSRTRAGATSTCSSTASTRRPSGAAGRRDAALRARRAGGALVAAARRARARPPRCRRLRFDARRNWAFVRALLSDPEAEVQWIFIHRGLAAALLHEATQRATIRRWWRGRPSSCKQPSDSGAARRSHARRLLLRVQRDRRLGCVDKGPVRWWKKMWKYMRRAVRAAARRRRSGRTRSRRFGRLFRGELPLTLSSARRRPAEPARASSRAVARAAAHRPVVGFVVGADRRFEAAGGRAPSRTGRSRRRDRLAGCASVTTMACWLVGSALDARGRCRAGGAPGCGGRRARRPGRRCVGPGDDAIDGRVPARPGPARSARRARPRPSRSSGRRRARSGCRPDARARRARSGSRCDATASSRAALRRRRRGAR